MEKSILIIGAGIAGLSAGCYARMNNYKTTILEMHDKPGGLCTAWKRKGYTWDISMHMLFGSLSGPFHRMWKELGVVQNREFFYRKLMSRIESRDGRILEYSTDRQQMEDQMLKLSPEDASMSREFIRLVFGKNITGGASLKPRELSNFLDTLRMLPVMLPLIGIFSRYRKKTVQEFAGQFRDPFLRKAVQFFIDMPGWPMLQYPMVALAGFMKSAVSEAGTPIGGSQQVVYGIADLYRKLGGAIEYKNRVKDVIIKNNRATGVRLEDGSERNADTIVWAADGHKLIFDILGGRYINNRIQTMYRDWIPVKPMVHVMLGVNRDFSKEPRSLILELEKPITIADEEHWWMSVMHHCSDHTAAPEGKSALEVWYATRYDYWEELVRDRTAYNEEKQRIAEYSITELNKRWPGFASQVEVVDVPTPATYVRYTGNWQGSPDGWYITPGNMRNQSPLRSLPGLSELYTIGQWTAPFTGTVIAALTGRQLVQLLCRKDGKKFVTG
jgi:phytoene dehydrogenase-like protein